MNEAQLENDPLFKKVMSIDFESCTKRLEKQWGVDDTSTLAEALRPLKAIIYYRQYLHLRAKYPDAIMVPFNADVDAAWHAHILDTRKYAEDCQMLFGRFLHHDPALQRGTRAHHEASERTRRLFLEAFPAPRNPFDATKTMQETHGEPWPPADHDFDPDCG